MSQIPETEQWLLDGKCSLCRRYKHCSKPCTKAKRYKERVLHDAMIQAMDNVTGGAYSSITNELYQLTRKK